MEMKSKLILKIDNSFLSLNFCKRFGSKSPRLSPVWQRRWLLWVAGVIKYNWKWRMPEIYARNLDWIKMIPFTGEVMTYPYCLRTVDGAMYLQWLGHCPLKKISPTWHVFHMSINLSSENGHLYYLLYFLRFMLNLCLMAFKDIV